MKAAASLCRRQHLYFFARPEDTQPTTHEMSVTHMKSYHDSESATGSFSGHRETSFNKAEAESFGAVNIVDESLSEELNRKLKKVGASSAPMTPRQLALIGYRDSIVDSSQTYLD